MVFISVFTVLSLCFVLTAKTKLRASLTPLTVISSVLILLLLFGICNALKFGVYFVLVSAVLLLLWAIASEKAKLWSIFKRFACPGIAFFIAASLMFYFTLQWRNPALHQWDEFSFWGIACKVVLENDKLYTLVHSSMINISYPPMLSLFNYFIQFFNASIVEWQIYYSYDLIMMAVMTALFSRVEWKNPVTAVILTVFSLFALYSFYYASSGLYLYVNAYADVIVGVVFGGALAVWYGGEGKRLSRYLSTMAVLALVTLTKDIGFALALVAAGIISIDMLISGSSPTRSKKFIVRVIYPILLMLSVVVTYYIWSMHFTSVTSIARVTIPYQYSVIDMLMGKDEYFKVIVQKMIDALPVKMLVTFGTVSVMLVAFTVAPLLLTPFVKKRKNIIRIVCFTLLALAGFAAYYLFHAYMYTAIFPHTDTFDLYCYDRYISSYPIGWLIGGVAVMLSDISAPCVGFLKKKLKFLPALMIISAFLFSIWYYTPCNFDQYVYISRKVELPIHSVRESFRIAASRYEGVLDENDKLYLVCQGTEGAEWFLFNYEFLPAYTEKSFGGGYFVSKNPSDNQNSDLYGYPFSREDFEKQLIENEIDYVFVAKRDEYFDEEFRPMFTDYLGYFDDGTHVLYRVVVDGESVSLEPVISSEAMLAYKQEG